MKSLNEIRIMQELSIKKRVPVSSVPDKYKKVYRQFPKKNMKNSIVALSRKECQT